jgi:predicted permease
MAVILAKLAVIFGAIALGWIAASRGWLGALQEVEGGRRAPVPEIARILSAVCFTLLIPALLLRTMVRIELAATPWRMLAAYMLPLLVWCAVVYAWRKRRPHGHAAEPATRAIAVSYGNAVQLGIPIAAALFGEAGLALHVAIVSVHGILLLLLLTLLVELDLARGSGAQGLAGTLATTARQLLLHPVVLPVGAGLAWNLTGFGLHPLADELLALLGRSAIPVCLLLIGISLATYGLRGAVGSALPLVAAKLFVLPALVLVIARFGFGLDGMPLAVLVMMAALPAGANALIFSQRYGVLQAEVTAAVVLGTLAFVASASLWLAVLGAIEPTGFGTIRP